MQGQVMREAAIILANCLTGRLVRYHLIKVRAFLLELGITVSFILFLLRLLLGNLLQVVLYELCHCFRDARWVVRW